MKNKRIKKVFSNVSELSTVFGIQKEGRTSTTHSRDRCHEYTRAFFEGPRMYSYGHHYLLAVLKKFNGLDVAVVNRTNWSHSTSGHASEVAGELRKRGYLVIDADTFDKDVNGLTSSSSAEYIDFAVIKYYERQAERYQTDLLVMTFKPQWPSGINWTLRDIRSHNKLVQKIGLSRLVVKVNDSEVRFARKLAELDTTASTGHCHRKQANLFEASGYNYRLYRLHDRKTA